MRRDVQAWRAVSAETYPMMQREREPNKNVLCLMGANCCSVHDTEHNARMHTHTCTSTHTYVHMGVHTLHAKQEANSQA